MIFGAHLLTLVLCFFPWFSAELSSGSIRSEKFFYTAFSGPGFLIGVALFLFSLFVVVVFLDELLGINRIKLPLSRASLYLVVGAQQVFLLLLVWSMLHSLGSEFSVSEIRFGIFFVFVAQVTGLVAAFLNAQAERQAQAKRFFRHPTKPEKEKKLDKHKKSEDNDAPTSLL